MLHGPSAGWWFACRRARTINTRSRTTAVGVTADPDRGGGLSRCQGRGGGRRPPGALARRSPLALEAGGEAFRGLAGRNLAHRAGYAERSAEQLLLRAQRGQPLFVRARNIGAQ